jgi:hypothetical protein
MKEKLGPFRIYDKDGYLLWEGEPKEIVFEDEYGRRWRGEVLPRTKEPVTPVKAQKVRLWRKKKQASK